MPRRPLAALLFAVFVDRLDMGVLIPVLPLLFADPSSDVYLLDGPESLSTGYVLLGLVGGAYAQSAFLASPLLGQLADRYGRSRCSSPRSRARSCRTSSSRSASSPRASRCCSRAASWTA